MRIQLVRAASVARPVVVTQRCTGCKTCIRHCSGDVLAFDRSSGKAMVKESRECRADCRICARVCLTGAVTFPDEEAFVCYLHKRLDRINSGLATVGSSLATGDAPA